MKKLSLILALSAFSFGAYANDCAVEVTSNDAMQYGTKELTIPKSCESYTITLKHIGKLPVTAMGHNLVISKTADKSVIASEGISKKDTGYLNTEDKRIIAHTDMIGGGEESSVTFKTDALVAGEDYSFFCTFPGHIAIMTGKLNVTE